MFISFSGAHTNNNPDFFLRGLEDIIESYYNSAKKFLRTNFSKERVFILFFESILRTLKSNLYRYGTLIHLVEDKLSSLT